MKKKRKEKENQDDNMMILYNSKIRKDEYT
jgi:hypothetical protein